MGHTTAKMTLRYLKTLSTEEACIREVLEETGLEARVTKLVGVFTSPDIAIEYADGNLIHRLHLALKQRLPGANWG